MAVISHRSIRLYHKLMLFVLTTFVFKVTKDEMVIYCHKKRNVSSILRVMNLTKAEEKLFSSEPKVLW